MDKGQGRIKQRTWEVTTRPTEYLGPDGPGCQQVFGLGRERRTRGEVEVRAVLGITRLPRERAGGRELLGVTRGHGGSANGLHGVRDGTPHEDASRLREESGPEVLAALRHIVIV